MGTCERKNMICFNSGKGISLLGTQLYNFMLAIMILKITGSAISFSIILVVSMLPRILFSTLAGILADRYSRKKLIIISDTLSALTLLLLWGSNMLFEYNLYAIYIFTFILNTTNILFDVTMLSAITSLFSKEKVQKACSVNEGITSCCLLLSPILGGALSSLLDFNEFIIINFMSFVFSIILESFLEFKPNTKVNLESNEKKSIIREINDVINYIKMQKIILLLYSSAIVINFCFSLGVNVSFPYIILNELGMSEFNYGILNVAISLGMILSSIVLSFSSITKKYFLIISSFLLEAICIFMIGVPIFLNNLMDRSLFIFYFIILFILGIAQSVLNINVRTYMQRIIPDEKKGKVLGTLAAFCSCVVPFTTIISGIFMEMISPFILPLISGIIFLLLTLVVFLNKDLKKIE